ncbi:hypothetical protein [Bordetella hinzii]|uniref:hypothetical protein n=1 Tax=Bordetella hinzii TaxID=103855 RepID=UPI001C02DE09|nr:hypothetical protein [Bordetella hinzii]QWF40044.1 hypothetical protein HHA25_18095 [Bordetella hinzii]QWF44591.1 hypothetical protein HHA24_18090 [Bordetella hinzii]QWF49127.1 hypothetical protein HHA23_18090 [Bordetella hinzii]QWF53663.1 hypothetical protein HHA22_18095 [Bordetella hinzii]QWF58153.1 hypothetical protein HHA21_17850 [Bordetella hinzii]
MVDFASQLQLPDYSRLAGGVQGLIGLQGNLLQQQQLQQQMDANIAASEAMKRATDPVTGKLDQSKFAALMSQGPGAYNLPTYLKNATELENLQLETQAKRFDLQQKQLGFWNGQLGALMSKGRNVSTKDVVQSLSNGLALGMITPDQAQQYADAIPSSPDELAEWIKQHWIGLQSAKDQAQFMMPNVQMVDTGGSMNIVPVDTLTGVPKGAITAFQKSLTPEAAAQRITSYDPATGQLGTTSLGSTVGGMPGSAQGGGFMATSAPMGQEKIAGAAADRYNSLIEAAGNAPAAINGYDRALEALQGAQTSGKMADAKLFIPTMLQSLGLQSEGGVVQDYQSLKKYLANAGAQAASAAGYSGSDARLASFTQGQPDPERMNPGALRDAIQYVKALQTGVLAKNNAAQAWLEKHGGNTAKLPEFERRWSNAFSPDVMELRNMAPEQQRAYIAGLSEAKRKALMDAYRKMSEVGAF